MAGSNGKTIIYKLCLVKVYFAPSILFLLFFVIQIFFVLDVPPVPPVPPEAGLFNIVHPDRNTGTAIPL